MTIRNADLARFDQDSTRQFTLNLNQGENIHGNPNVDDESKKSYKGPGRNGITDC